MSYDSTEETTAHIERVRELLLTGPIKNLGARALAHDASKLEESEKAIFDEYTPKLRELEYGTPEYRQALADMGPALEHHYAKNDHHPEHFGPLGVRDMDLLQIIEMLADWKAAGERHADADEIKTCPHCEGRGTVSLWEGGSHRGIHTCGYCRGKRELSKLERSIATNQSRFNMSQELTDLLYRTAATLEWL